MKRNPILRISLTVLALALPGSAEPKKPVYRDAESHDLIVRKMKVTEKLDPIKSLVPSEGEDPSKNNQPKDLISSSDVISFNGFTTLVPKRAIIQTPNSYKDRINNHTLGNKIVSWMDFYKLNRGWITTVEVTRAQAEGKEPLAEEVSDNLSKSGNLVIATYSTGPISMMPPKVEEKAINDQAKPIAPEEP